MNQPARRQSQVNNRDRERIVRSYENGENFLDLANNLGINRDTARSIIRVWISEGRIERLPTGGRRRVRVDQAMIATILEIARQQPFTTLMQIKETLQQRLPDKPQVHVSTISRHLEGNLISVKIAGKDADVPRLRNIPETKQKRYEYFTWLTSLNLNDNIINIDECGFNLFTRRTQGRAPIGQPVRQEVVGHRMRNINLIMAINADLGLVAFDLQQNTLNHARYQQFIDYLIGVEAAPRLQGLVHIVHDGARPHINTTIQAGHANRFRIHLLPPYSPFLNPVEQANSCFKAAVSRSLTSPEIRNELNDDNRRLAIGLNQTAWKSRILLQVARTCLNEITQNKCANWCRRVDRFIAPSLARNDILG